MARKPQFGSIYRRGATWWIKYYRERKRFYESSESVKQTDAQQLLDQRRAEILAGPHLEGRTRKLVMNELFDVLVRDYKINGKDHSWCERVTRKHLRPFFGAVPAMKVRPETVAKYIEHRLAERAANATVNREIALLRRAFNLARRSGKINAVQMLPSKLSENNVRKGFFERDDFLTASLSTSRRDQTDRHVRVLERMSEGRDSSFAVIAGGFGEQDHPPRTRRDEKR